MLEYAYCPYVVSFRIDSFQMTWNYKLFIHFVSFYSAEYVYKTSEVDCLCCMKWLLAFQLLKTQTFVQLYTFRHFNST